MQRTIGNWSVSGGMDDVGREVYGEDGVYWQSRMVWHLEASHRDGRIFTYDGSFASEAEAQAFVDAIPRDFDAVTDGGWAFWRNSYGSASWGHDDEVAMMDEEERAHHGL